jgi:WD40 repeat protein
MLWSPAGGDAVKTLTGPGDIWDVAFGPDSASVGASYTKADAPGGWAGVWSGADDSQRFEVPVDDGYGAPFAVTFSHDGKLLATGGGSGEIRFWDAATGAQIGRSVFGAAGWVETLAFIPDDTILVSAGSDGTVRLIDASTQQQVGSSLPGGNFDAIAAVGPDGRVFVDYKDIGNGYVWDISLPSLESHACSLAGRTLTTNEWDQYLPGRSFEPTCTGG